jgi:methylated-DNA-[protein]-cysteine S-methyltransferase
MNNNSRMDLNKENKNGSTNTIRDSDVYDLLLKIPEGYVSTYGDLARALGSPSASRLIGRILGNNPNPIKVPCHRVVKSDGKLGGYRYGIDKKKDLLQKEGISITNGAIVSNFENIRFNHQYFKSKKSD